MRARLPDREGYVDRDGVRVVFDVYENDAPTVLLLPTWAIIHSRHWKAQIAYLSRHFRLVVIEGRGNGRSDRPLDPAQYDDEEHMADFVAILDETDTRRAVVAGVSQGGHLAAIFAGLHPERVEGAVLIAPATALTPPHPERLKYSWSNRLDTTDGWAKHNSHFWRSNYPDFADFFFSQIFTEPHSTKQCEDSVGWALETSGEVLIATVMSRSIKGDEARRMLESVRCPVLVIHGSNDMIIPHAEGVAVAEITDGTLITIEGGGHCPQARDPVVVNRAIRNFVESSRMSAGMPASIGFVECGGEEPAPKSTIWTRGLDRQRRALYVSSPIGLGHARRDVAIANELQQLHPDLAIDWLAQNPVTTVLESEGHTIHPASRWLASESAHIASESSGHDLNAFQALRSMDEILVANFMIFQEVIEEGAYDLVIADEAWDIDHFWHENPELKQGSHVWMTDFVGFVPMPDGGEREAYLTADYNAEMVEHVARFPRIRDRSVFVGNVDDVVPDPLGPDLPGIREWTTDHFEFPGYVTGFIPPTPDEAAEMRTEFGYDDDERICVVTVGGSGVGRALLEQVIAAYPYVHEEVPNLRMLVVAGPRLDPESFDVPAGVEIVGYIDRLYRHLSVCDLAVVQGGLTTTMELTAAQRPFLYFPLRNHFEQNRHVRYRLDRYRAGRCMDYDSSGPEEIARAMVEELERAPDYRPVETDGAARAAALISELI